MEFISDKLENILGKYGNARYQHLIFSNTTVLFLSSKKANQIIGATFYSFSFDFSEIVSIDKEYNFFIDLFENSEFDICLKNLPPLSF